MHKNVEIVIGRLVTDPQLRRRFSESAAEVLEELTRQGLELTSVELDALARTDTASLRFFAGSLDRRLCRASMSLDSRLADGVTHAATRKEKVR